MNMVNKILLCVLLFTATVFAQRTGTPHYNIGMWPLGAHAGAGSMTGDSDSLNGNWWKVDSLVHLVDSLVLNRVKYSDSTGLFVTLTQLGLDTANARAYSNALYQAKGTYLISSDSTAFRNYSSLLYVINPMSALGDLIYGGAGGLPVNLSGNTTATQKFLSQTGTGSISAAPSWQTIPSQGNLTYYFTATNSGLSNSSALKQTDLQMASSPYTPKTTIDTAQNANVDTTLISFATNAGVPNLQYIPAGQFEFHIHASIVSGSRHVVLYGRLREVSATGTNIGTIGTSEVSSFLTGSETEYRLYFVIANTYSMASTASRLVLDVRATFTNNPPNGNTVVRLYVGDEADSHIALPSSTVDVTNFVPYTGAITNLNLGTHTVAAANIGTMASADSSYWNTKLSTFTKDSVLVNAPITRSAGSGSVTMGLDTTNGKPTAIPTRYDYKRDSTTFSVVNTLGSMSKADSGTYHGGTGIIQIGADPVKMGTGDTVATKAYARSVGGGGTTILTQTLKADSSLAGSSAQINVVTPISLSASTTYQIDGVVSADLVQNVIACIKCSTTPTSIRYDIVETTNGGDATAGGLIFQDKSTTNNNNLILGVGSPETAVVRITGVVQTNAACNITIRFGDTGGAGGTVYKWSHLSVWQSN